MISNRPTILVVEDDPIIRNLIVDILTRQGWVVFEADTAAEAQIVCNALKDERLDLLIVDDQVSEPTDRGPADRVLAGWPHAKILRLSAAPALMPGSGYLKKPFTSGQLILAVESLLHPRTQ